MSGWMGGCQGGWERRIEAFVKIKIFFFLGGGGWGVGGGGVGGEQRIIEAFVKIQKKKKLGGGIGLGGRGVKILKLL